MILQLASNKYIDTEAYGIKTWGSLSQTSVIKKTKNWYVHTSCCEDAYNDIWISYDYKLKVIAEFTDKPVNVVLDNQEEVDCFNEMLNRR